MVFRRGRGRLRGHASSLRLGIVAIHCCCDLSVRDTEDTHPSKHPTPAVEMTAETMPIPAAGGCITSPVQSSLCVAWMMIRDAPATPTPQPYARAAAWKATRRLATLRRAEGDDQERVGRDDVQRRRRSWPRDPPLSDAPNAPPAPPPARAARRPRVLALGLLATRILKPIHLPHAHLPCTPHMPRRIVAPAPVVSCCRQRRVEQDRQDRPSPGPALPSPSRLVHSRRRGVQARRYVLYRAAACPTPTWGPVRQVPSRGQLASTAPRRQPLPTTTTTTTTMPYPPLRLQPTAWPSARRRTGRPCRTRDPRSAHHRESAPADTCMGAVRKGI